MLHSIISKNYIYKFNLLYSNNKSRYLSSKDILLTTAPQFKDIDKISNTNGISIKGLLFKPLNKIVELIINIITIIIDIGIKLMPMILCLS